MRKHLILLSIILLAGSMGYSLGSRGITINTAGNGPIIRSQPPKQVQTDFSLFWDVWERIHTQHIDSASIDDQQLLWGSISGMVNAVGDPYTTFLSPKENTEFKEDMSGSFEGIGAQLGTRDGMIIVVAPLKGSPAEKAGIRAGDWIMKVFDEETIGWTVTQAVSKIRGKKGTPVTLLIQHEDETAPVEISIIRNTILVPSVDYWTKAPRAVEESRELISGLDTDERRVSYIHLSRFGDRLETEWQEAVDAVAGEVRAGSTEGLILDLRNNPGGYLDGSIYIASEFIGSGTVVTQENSDGSKEVHDVVRKGRLLDIPMVVLINEGSASSAEIVAGALKDTRRATIIGMTSFGKGSVQTPQDLRDGSALHVTTGKWLTPSGESISDKGIVPDIQVAFTPDTEASGDAQLAKAIEFLLQ